MCGISGIKNMSGLPISNVRQAIRTMSTLQRHRGPDGSGEWVCEDESIAFGHLRLSIIDLSPEAAQPMTDGYGNWITYNGEIYNYRELRTELGSENFRTQSDTEVILMAYRRWGKDCVNHFRGMFSFALWDEREKKLFCARDRFGIKPFYYTVVDQTVYFASEVKALLPYLESIDTDLEGFKDYIAFQFCLAGKTLFQGVKELLPAHWLEVRDGSLTIQRYWEVYFNPDYEHTAKYFTGRIQDLLEESVQYHLRSDVPVGAYVSGGLDSGTVASLAIKYQNPGEMMGFVGKFSAQGEAYDESAYARLLAQERGFDLHEVDITASDFVENIRSVIYHMDYPVAGPGSFSQFMVSKLAAKHRKVVLGGQGGDEIFGGYTRYLVAYFEQCIKGAIEGTINSGRFVVTYESIIPNLVSLRNYKPMLQEFWREGLFEPMDRRYYRLVNRAPNLGAEINWEALEPYSARETFRSIFNGNNVRKESYFDQMTHFDFKTLLPALLQVEDRMSMAHGLESRVPLLDHKLVEFAATIPADIKFKDGEMKHIFREVVRPVLPEAIMKRKDKMGFPTPVVEWMTGDAKEFIHDILSSNRALSRDLVNNRLVLEQLNQEKQFGRKGWGLLCLEIWQQEFHDQAYKYRDMVM